MSMPRSRPGAGLLDRLGERAAVDRVLNQARAEHSAELQATGWVVRVVDNFAHELVTHPDVVAPLIREFLDAHVER